MSMFDSWRSRSVPRMGIVGAWRVFASGDDADLASQPFVIGSYHTPNYAGLAMRLQGSVATVGHKSCVVAGESVGSWVENCATKADALLAIKSCYPAVSRIVFVDSDAVLREPLTRWVQGMMAARVGFAARISPGESDRRNIVRSGTLYADFTVRGTGDLIRKWRDQSSRNRFDLDQWTLARVLGAEKALSRRSRALEGYGYPGVCVASLPETLCAVFDARPKGAPPAVIEHFQASRQHRDG